MASPLTSTPLNRFLALIPDNHSHRTQSLAESAIVDSRSGSQTDLSITDDSAKLVRADSTGSATSTDSSKSSAGGFSFLKLGN